MTTDPMTDLQDWQECNAQYLSAAVAWVRARLESMAQGQQSSDSRSPSSVPAAERRSLFSWAADRSAPAASPTLVVTSSSDADFRRSADGCDPPPALEALSRRFGLSDFEHNILLLCAAVELDTRIAGLCARSQEDPQRPYPTFGLALALFDEPTWDALVPERPLRYWRLIEINQAFAMPLTASPLRADERIVHYVKGANYMDDRLTPLLSPLMLDREPDGTLPAPPPSQEEGIEMILGYWQQTPANTSLPVAQLLGADASSKHLVARVAAARLGYQLCRLTADMLPANQAELETLARLWQRESLLLPLALYLDAQELDGGDAQLALVHRFLARCDGLLFLGVREALPHTGRSSFAVDVARPTPAEQRAEWTAVLGTRGSQDAKLLAGQFSLNVADIRRIASMAGGLAAQRSADTGEAPLSEAEAQDLMQVTLWEVARDNDRPRLDALAQRLTPKATWADLVLPEAETRLLRQIAAQVRQRDTVYEEWGFRAKMNRGMGISALFAGDSGTGKTMAAEVIANDLRLNLYRIDLSAVVSKYIGETEKNLRRLFDAAEGGSAILFFDEADALFGKRSEVKDSHDRYANIEINYLLQRMESYSGLAILATNMKSALDQAFMRRLRFIVDFPFPGPVERKLMWQKVFPEAMRKDHLDEAGLDYDKLALLDQPGGNIHNVALNAAFAAAHAGERVTMQTIFDAARQELRKQGRPVNKADLR